MTPAHVCSKQITHLPFGKVSSRLQKDMQLSRCTCSTFFLAALQRNTVQLGKLREMWAPRWPDIVLELLKPQDCESHDGQELRLSSWTVRFTREDKNTHAHTPWNICVLCCCVSVSSGINSGRYDWNQPVKLKWGEGWEKGQVCYEVLLSSEWIQPNNFPSWQI